MNKNERRKLIAHEVLIILGILALLTFITRLWPILLLVMLGILICALRLLFLRTRTVEVIVPEPTAAPPPPETELSIIRMAFGLLQRRISEQLEHEYPGARWVWGMANAIERFRHNEPLIVFLNRAAGYDKALVVVHNLQFRGLRYLGLAPDSVLAAPDTDAYVAESLHEHDGTGETEAFGEAIPDDEPVNYGRLAFKWVDANMGGLNSKINEAIARGNTDMLIPAEELPHPDSWPDVCAELKRNGFDLADFCEAGIKANTTP